MSARTLWMALGHDPKSGKGGFYDIGEGDLIIGRASDREDALLFKAAPDLLAALKRCEAMVSEGAGPPNWDWIREVIKAAEGH